MLGIMQKMVSAASSQLRQLSSFPAAACGVLNRQPLTSRLTNSSVSTILSPLSASTSVVNTDVPCRGKCFDHHFLNRWMARDYKRRAMLKKHTPMRQRYVAIKRCSVLPKSIQELASQELSEFPRDSCYSRAHKRCILTSRPRWCIHKYRVSRIQWRLLADYNKLSGVTRATW